MMSLGRLKQITPVLLFCLGVTVYTPTNIQNQSHVIAMFESGAGVEVIENKGHLTARVYLPMTFLVTTCYKS